MTARVRADRRHVQQVLDHRVGNALDHAREGGTVVLSADELPDYLQVSVADDRPRVPLRDQERIFEPFVAGAERSGGAGLGLAIARQIVRAHGGDIWDAMYVLMNPDVEIMLLDLKMPGVDGMEVLEHIERERPGLRVVIITAHGTVDRAVESMNHGALDVVQKPFSVETIRSLVRREMDPGARSEAARTHYDEHLDRDREQIRGHRLDAAQEQVREAITEDESRPEAFNLAGVIAYLRHDRVETQKQWRLALAHDTTYRPAEDNLRRSARWPRKEEPWTWGIPSRSEIRAASPPHVCRRRVVARR